MRVSVDPADPGYRLVMAATSQNKRVVVMLDGIEQQHIFMADDALGIIDRAALDADGQMVSDGAGWISERVAGVVSIAFTDWEPLT